MDEAQAFRRSHLLAAGIAPHEIERALRCKAIGRVHRGVYVSHREADRDVLWRRRLAAHLLRGGPSSAVSHRAAAIIGRFDGWVDLAEPWPEDVTVPANSSFRSAPAMRSRVLSPADVVNIGALRVTSVARTLADLGRFVTTDDLELAVESALRAGQQRPDQWQTDLLDELVACAAGQARGSTALARLRAVLARRPSGARPTGSPAETRALQALRGVGLGGLIRQPTIRFFDHRGRLVREVFPDLGAIERLFLVEIDGFIGHHTRRDLDRDLRRQFQLTEAFTVVRISASRVAKAPHDAAREVHARWVACPPRPPMHRIGSVIVNRTADGADIRPA